MVEYNGSNVILIISIAFVLMGVITENCNILELESAREQMLYTHL